MIFVALFWLPHHKWTVNPLFLGKSHSLICRRSIRKTRPTKIISKDLGETLLSSQMFIHQFLMYSFYTKSTTSYTLLLIVLDLDVSIRSSAVLWHWMEKWSQPLDSPGRSVLIIHFFIESGLKWFNSKQNSKYSFKKIFIQ